MLRNGIGIGGTWPECLRRTGCPERGPTGMQFTGPNRDGMNAGSRSTVKQRFGSGATAELAVLTRLVRVSLVCNTFDAVLHDGLRILA